MWAMLAYTVYGLQQLCRCARECNVCGTLIWQFAKSQHLVGFNLVKEKSAIAAYIIFITL